MRLKCLAVVLMALMALLVAPAVVFAAPVFSVDAVPNKTAYYVGEAASLTVKVSWSGLSQSYTVNVELWNSTAKLAALKSGLSIPGASQPNGTISETYQVNVLTQKAGSFVYYVKIVEASTGLAVAQDSFTITVQRESIVLSVAWEDASKDRIVEVNEPLTFTVFISWAFVNQSFTGTVYVVDQGMETVLGTVDFTVGSGSKQLTYYASYETPGAKTVAFRVEDAAGKSVASKTVSLVVSGQAAEKGFLGSVMDWINEHQAIFYAIVIILGLIIVALLIRKR